MTDTIEEAQKPEVENMLTGHPTGKSTEEYLLEVMFEGIPSHVRKHDSPQRRSKHWPDGTRRLIPSDLSKDDLAIFTRFKDLCVYDRDGDYILELCIAKHEEYLERKKEKIFSKFKGLVQHQTRNKVGRNDPCPCGAAKVVHKNDGELDYDIDVPVKYKHCCGHWSAVPKSIPPVDAERVAAEAALEADPQFQALSKQFKEGEIGVEDFYAAMGLVKHPETGEFVVRETLDV
jgi:hypothetical protein